MILVVKKEVLVKKDEVKQDSDVREERAHDNVEHSDGFNAEKEVVAENDAGKMNYKEKNLLCQHLE